MTGRRWTTWLAWGLIVLAAVLSRGCTSQRATAQIGIPAGVYQIGTDDDERQWGYRHSPPLVRRQHWYDAWELAAQRRTVAGFSIDRQPVTQAQYGEFVRASGHPRPFISRQAYFEQGFLVHGYARVVPYLWHEALPPVGLARHPVVLVSRADAEAYCQWRGLRLPTEAEWEAACRGPGTRRFAWGDRWQGQRLQSGALGTSAVDAHPDGATPEGVIDLLGNVFEWTSSWLGGGAAVLKGCSWDDAPGSCRCGFRHGRAAASKHILIGFRCAASVSPE